MVAAVHCHISNGISLQIFEMKDVGLGVKEAKKKGQPVELKTGLNKVDQKFWDEWFEQNKNSPIVTNRGVELVETKEKV